MKRFFSILGVVLTVAAFGFWLRPISYYDGFTYLEEVLSGVRSHNIQVAGYRIHYEVEGPEGGPPVVLVHGLGGNADGWRGLAPYFKHAGYRVYMPELLGYGDSEKPQDFSYSIRDEAAIVVGFIDALGLKQVALGGWSMGGWIVQVVAAGSPQHVSRLMLFDSAGLYQPPTWDTHLFTPASLDQLNQLDALLTSNTRPLPKFVGEDLLRTSRGGYWVISRAMNQMWTGRDVTDNLLPHLTMPVLIEWGADDHIIPLSQGETIHRLVPNSQLDVFPGCGHLAPLRCVDQMGPKVVAFLQGVAPPPSTPTPHPQKPPILASPRDLAANTGSRAGN